MSRSIANRLEKLREEIHGHDHAYYVLAQPVISDRQYDALLEELRQLEEEHPELMTPDSPTQRVGGEPITGFAHVAHAVRMFSVDNTYNPDQLREFDRRVASGLGGEGYRYLVDPKIDGVAVSLIYENGRLVTAVTRGDGITGDDITHNVRTIRSVPLRLSGSSVPSVIDVRGEICWPTSLFRKHNEQRIKEGLPPFANPRNAAAGTLKQLDPRSVAGRGLMFVSHGVGRIEPLRVGHASELFGQFEKWGIPVSPYRQLYDSVEKVIEDLPQWQQRRHEYPYETDGLVVKVDAFDQRDVLGATSRHPRWCIAYKFEAEQAQSVVLKVDFQIGKQGTITPRAIMEPMQLSGTTVRHATLHNFDQLDRLGVRIGDTVIVEKAGEIIPQVVEVVLDKRPKNAKEIKRPTKCPVCSGEVEKDEGGVYLRCINPTCPAQLKERLIHFAGRNQMDIEGLGEVLVEKMVDKGWLHSYADIYDLPNRRDDIARIEIEQERKNKDGTTKITLTQFGEKRTQKMLDGIERSKKQPISRLLAGLNIRHVGTSTAELLAEHFGSMKKIMEATEEELIDVEGIGPELAASIRHFFTSKAGRDVIRKLDDAGVNMSQPKRKPVAGSALSGKTVVITGSLSRMSRKEAQDVVKRLGGSAAGSVTKKTDFVVVGESPGSKLDDATRLGVRIIDEDEFLELTKTR